MNGNTPTLDRLRQRAETLQARHGYRLLDAEVFDDFIGMPGSALILFAEDPARVPETWDLTVILPELVDALATPLRVGILAPAAARSLAPRYGISLWPALLLLRDGQYLGSIEGLRDWGIYLRRLAELLAAAPSRPPGIGIAVASAGSTCH